MFCKGLLGKVSKRARTGPSNHVSSFNAGSNLKVKITACCRAAGRGYRQLPAQYLLQKGLGSHPFIPKENSGLVTAGIAVCSATGLGVVRPGPRITASPGRQGNTLLLLQKFWRGL